MSTKANEPNDGDMDDLDKLEAELRKIPGMAELIDQEVARLKLLEQKQQLSQPGQSAPDSLSS
jgi:hypothetical protein